MRCSVVRQVLLQCLVCLLPIDASAAILHVPSAYPSIQAGISASSFGDTVLIACGTYEEHDIIMRTGICLRSESGDPACVTIDAQGKGRVLTCDRIYSQTLIEGITFSGGHASGSYPDYYGGGMYCSISTPQVTNCVFSGNTADQLGGGLYLYSSSPLLTNCVFSECSATSGGGGMAAVGGSWPRLIDCEFVDNASPGRGGAVLSDNSSPIITSCQFSDNSAGEGGGVFYVLSSPSLTGCTFSGNTANMGGGVACSGNSSPEIVGCVFVGNTAETHGGGLSCRYASPTLSDCLLVDNAARCGAGLDLWHASPSVTGCTFVGNHADGCPGGGISCNNGSSPTVRSCIVAFSSSGEGIFVDDMTCNPSISCCNVYGNAGGDWIGDLAGHNQANGNFSADPLFCDATGGDFTLCEDSPCLKGSRSDDEDCDERIGAFGEGCGACNTPVALTTWGRLKAMFDE